MTADRSTRKRPPPFPLWILIPYTLYVCVHTPIYFVRYEITNFLWFSEIVFIGSLVAMWTRSRLLAGMMALAGLLPDLGWNLDFWVGVFSGGSVTGATAYMFNEDSSLFLRGMSLFHVAIPPILIYMMYRLRYDRRALPAMTVACWGVLIVTYLTTDPALNTNWVFGPVEPQTVVPPPSYLVGLMLLFPVIFYVPTHFLLKWWFPQVRGSDFPSQPQSSL